MTEARKYGAQAQQIFNLLRENQNAQAQLRAPIFEDKVVDLIVSQAKVKEKKVSKDDLMKEDDLPAGYFGMLRLAVGTYAAWVRIRRRANDLADPHHAVLLPELYEPARDQARARLRWNPDGLLALRSIDPDEAR